MTEMDEFFVTGKAGNAQQMKASWFEIFVKGPLRYVLVDLLGKYPEPKTAECTKKNSLAWLRIRDRFLSFERNQRIVGLAKLCLDVIIGEHLHDPPYEERTDFIGEEITKAYLCGQMVPRNHPSTSFWEEPATNDLNTWFDLEKRLSDAILPPPDRPVNLAAVQALQKECEELLSKWRTQLGG